MKDIVKTTDRLSPRRQSNWDGRAAANFICGGTGGGLLLGTALASTHGDDLRALVFVALAFIGLGLTCVWFEIGRPWRALNVYRHYESSWMTREAAVAPALFALGAATLWFGGAALMWLSGVAGLAFVYAQGRILLANKGIPAWRHPRCVHLIVATGLAEGIGALCVAALVWPGLIHVGVLLALLLTVRFVVWRRYVGALTEAGAPAGALTAFRAIDGGFVWVGNAIPAVVGLAGGLTGQATLTALAGTIAVLAGWGLKYTLICRAAFTQGFALPRIPVRGKGVSAAGVKPGWEKA